MDFALAPEDEAFRAELRGWLDVELPAFLAEWGERDEPEGGSTGRGIMGAMERRRAWQRRLNTGRWAAINWPKEWGGREATVTQNVIYSEEMARARTPGIYNANGLWQIGPMIIHWGTDEQKERYLRPLCEGRAMSCFAMTEPEVAGSDPTLIRTHAEQDGDEWVINGHKWFISNARRASFAILLARTEDDPELPQAANTAFIVDLPSEGWDRVREVETMHGGSGHSEIVITDLRVPAANVLGGRGQGHRLGQYRLGPARLAHCMRWLAQAEVALDMMVDRSLNRFTHGSVLAEKQGVQWLIADSAMELYQAKLMVLHAAYRIDNGLDFTSEVSMAKHFVANMLNRVIDRSIQVHGALGYSTDTPLAGMYQQARWARFADGADEIHQMRIAQRTIAAYRDHGSTRTATGDLPV